ncbi:MAG: branched-chain amino acid ABC transporter permease [Desulfitobacteriaceae bacterium]|nr:branched-chain amino acid ABC transporter permease [Desulfitobacteriaceae bacterium]MDI6914460.1 branched-chain amino acid ABC transporter permease [Desulfitobacteriaceae bacterium]
MDLFAQQLVNGLTLGSIYCLVALGLTLIYGIMEVPNFAHGHLYMVGAYVTFFAMTLYGLNYWLSALLAGVVLAVLGVLMERIVFHPLRHAPASNKFIAAVGAMMFLEALARVLWGSDFRSIPVIYDKVFTIGTLRITEQRLIVIIAAIFLMIALNLFLKKTIIGSSIEAMAQNRDGASLVGINVNNVAMLTFAIASILAAGAAALAGPIFLVFPSMGALIIMKAFVIIVIGGMGSIPGAVLGGYVLGITEAMGASYISTDYKDVVAFLVLILILTIKPTGIFAKGVR